MTIRSDQNPGVDTRRADYEQSIISLGIEKVNAKREVDRIKNEIIDIQRQRDEVRLQVTEAKLDLDELNIQKKEIQKDIVDALKRGSVRTGELKKQLREGRADIVDKETELDNLNDYLVSLNEQINTKTVTIATLETTLLGLSDEYNEVQTKLSKLKRKLDEVTEDVKSMYQVKKQVSDELDIVRDDLTETQAIVDTLKANNKEGLELVASFDGERKRLQNKDDFLRRKEADLTIYENRLRKGMEAAGIDIKMIFK
jgi:chromosome segregation ATPase